jgi:hypothetical protein
LPAKALAAAGRISENVIAFWHQLFSIYCFELCCSSDYKNSLFFEKSKVSMSQNRALQTFSVRKKFTTLSKKESCPGQNQRQLIYGIFRKITSALSIPS